MFAPKVSLRVLHIAPHPPDSGRSLPVPEHAIQSRAVRDVTSPGHASPLSKSPTRSILPNNIPLIILRTRLNLFFSRCRPSPHPNSRHERHLSLIVSGNQACCVEGYLAVCNLKLAYRRAGTVMRCGWRRSLNAMYVLAFLPLVLASSLVRPKAVCLSYTTPTSRQRLLITAHALVLCPLLRACSLRSRHRASEQAQG